jgi:16S rRNA (cytosine967-C5)-methyltransferase
VSKRVPTARSVAADVLVRVLVDGAFAAAALDTELERSVQLEERDRGLATELVYGTLRLLRWIEQRLDRYAKRGVGKLDPRVRAELAIAAYQILVLTRVPAFAAVNEAVGAIRALRGDKVAGFANAVLRKLAGEPRPTPEDLGRAAFEGAAPALRDAIVRAVGEDGARKLLGVHDLPPPLGLRIEDPGGREAWLARLREARPRASFELGRVSPLAIVARSAGRVVDLDGFREGAWTPQEEGSQIVALALGAREGDVVLDACAGRGNKTGLFVRAVSSRGAADAADLHPSKLERLERELSRLGRGARATYAVDWSVGTGDVTGPYDRVLVDAPCSGTGTLRRRPEILLRRVQGDIGELARLQRTILARAASLVRPGGRVVYAVCSVLREEAEDVVRGADALGLLAAPFDAAPAIAIAGVDATSFRLLPHEHGTDGYFVASFVRRAEPRVALP